MHNWNSPVPTSLVFFSANLEQKTLKDLNNGSKVKVAIIIILNANFLPTKLNILDAASCHSKFDGYEASPCAHPCTTFHTETRFASGLYTKPDLMMVRMKFSPKVIYMFKTTFIIVEDLDVFQVKVTRTTFVEPALSSLLSQVSSGRILLISSSLFSWPGQLNR